MTQKGPLCYPYLLIKLVLGFVLSFSTTQLLVVNFASAEIIDLSQDWQQGDLYNQNDLYCNMQAITVPAFLEGYMVIRNGKVLAEYYEEGSTPDDQIESWSLTKAWSSMLIGKMVDSNLVCTNETLGDIFDQPDDWEGVRQIEEKKTITLQEILSMTSGLKPCFYQSNIKDQETLQDVLDQVDYEEEFRGKFYYNERSHMLSRIILRRTGLTPFEFMEQEGIFAKLGINSTTDFSWDTFGGVEGTAVGLKTNPRVHAKLGQLYLQQGLAKEGDEQLISQEWIRRSSTNQLADGVINYLSPPGELDGYGYQGWFVNTPDYTGILEGFTVAFGLFGQIIAYQPSSNTTISIMGKPPAGSGTSYNFLKNIVENLPHLEVEQSDCDDARLRYVKYLRENGGEVSFLLWEQLKRFIRTFGAR